MAVVGSVPEQVVVVLQPEKEVTRAYTGEKFKVRPAFIVDANSEKMIASAKRWGSGGSYWNDTRLPPPDVLENVDNTPITSLCIIGVEHRGEGGIAYKIITPEGYYVDLREDEFMEAVFEDRIRGGVITGKYVWSRAGSQMRLVRVWSTKYLERLAAGKRVSKGRIPVRQLVVGHAYRGKTEISYAQVYLGRVKRSDDPKYKGKRFFAWRSLHLTGKSLTAGYQIYNYVTITQSSSMIEDLGPVDVGRGGVENYADGYGTGIRKSHVQWIK